MSLIQLGDFVINKNLSSISVNGENLSLEPKLFDLLMLFCEHGDQIISRQQILEKIWPNSIVTDNAVNKIVASLRKVLKDAPRSPKYIQTVPKRGYRLMVEVNAIDPKPKKAALVKPGSSQNNAVSTRLEFNSASGYKQKNKKLMLLAALTLAMAMVYLMLMWRPSQLEATPILPLEQSIKTQELTRMPGLELSPLMSPNHDFLVFLKEDRITGHRTLWQKSLIDESENKVDGLSQFASRLISIDKRDNVWQISYLAQQNKNCHISTVDLAVNNQLTNQRKIFDCTDMLIFDITWSADTQIFYYGARTKHETVSRIYQFDMATQSNSLITQPEAKGIGNRGIDLSPDGRKLLIVNLDVNFNSELYVLDLQTNRLTAGLKTKYNISKATWSHDNQRVMFYNPSPSHQVILSDIDGSTQKTLLNTSEYLETHFTRIPESKDILFSTSNHNFNNRWISHEEDLKEISNSTVYDTSPALAHNTANYAFVSTRSGQEQLYYGDLVSGKSHLISRFHEHRWIKHLSFSPNDQTLLVGDGSDIWLFDMKRQLPDNKLVALVDEQAIFKSDGSLIAATWLSNQYIYFKIQTKAKIKGYIFDRTNQHTVEVDNRWQTLLTDHKSANVLYMIDSVDTQIYQMPINRIITDTNKSTIKFPEHFVAATGTAIKQDYFDVKIYDGKIYYIIASQSGNTVPYDFQIEVKPLYSDEPQKIEIYKTSCSCGYDIADSGFMISEQVDIEGDIHRTTQ